MSTQARLLPAGTAGASALLLLLLCYIAWPERGATPPRWAGVARVDVTPDEPVWLTGFAARSAPGSGAVQPLWAKALAIGGGGDAPALWLTLDNCGITREVWSRLQERITRRTGIAASRLVLSISHTHCAPATTGWAPFILPESVSPEQSAAIDRYTDRLLDRMEAAAVEALAHPFPAKLSWSEGRTGFAANRRTPGGPVDHALPVLKVEDSAGHLKVLLASYACHCTTCGPSVERACGDWAGAAQAALERSHPGAVAMISIGCGADSNPSPRGGPDDGLTFAKQHGESLAAAVDEMLQRPFRVLNGALVSERIAAPLPFDRPFSKEEWKQRAGDKGIVGRHARSWLSRIESGATVPRQLPYEVTTWHFGRDLALVFLPGEVVVDYSLRLKRELDGSRVWINAYSDWVPCYIPSRRILAEGGYEAETSLWYYNRPGRLAPEAEQTIVNAVHAALPAEFEAVSRP